jgi:hypothetical protein
MGTLTRYRWVIALILLALAGQANAETAQELFKKGNADFAAGQFNQAVKDYQDARGQGLDHWILDYNLGNAYFKAGELGRAIASYSRAFQRNSGDRDIVHNLNLALAQAGDPLLPADGLSRFFWRTFYLPPMDLLSALSALIFLTVCIYGIGGLWNRWPLHTEFLGVAIATLVLAGGWFGARCVLLQRPQAIVVSGTAEVRGGPSLNYAANFTIPEGRRVLLLKEEEPVKGWVEIGVPQEGLKGWVPDSAVEPV